jgi:hypothetical protein
MNNLVRAAALSLTTVLALATVSACGSSDNASAGAPTTTSTAPATGSSDTTAPTDGTSTAASGDANALCSAITALPTGLSTNDPNGAVSALKSYGDALAGAGVPSDMPADAQTGLKDYINILQTLDTDKITQLENMGGNPTSIFGSDAAAGQAFFTYIATACASQLGSLGGASTATP